MALPLSGIVSTSRISYSRICLANSLARPRTRFRNVTGLNNLLSSFKRPQRFLFSLHEAVTLLLQGGAAHNDIFRLIQKKTATLIPSRYADMHAVEQEQHRFKADLYTTQQRAIEDHRHVVSEALVCNCDPHCVSVSHACLNSGKERHPEPWK